MQASAIIKGAPISTEDISEKDKYFSKSELPQINELAKNNKPIADYWLIVMQNFYEEDLAASDKEIGKAIQNISTDVTGDKFEVIFDIGKNEWLKAGKYSRRFLLQEGQPSKVEGDKVAWLQKKPIGILAKILDGDNSVEELQHTFPLVGELINDMVPYSLQFYMGVTVEDEDIELESDENE